MNLSEILVGYGVFGALFAILFKELLADKKEQRNDSHRQADRLTDENN